MLKWDRGTKGFIGKLRCVCNFLLLFSPLPVLYDPMQLLKELIERKTSYSESVDPIEMGRQWLELQKMRTKAKKNVDTKASKGRKLR